MQQTVENFLRALRAMNVRVSPAEAIDAHIAIDLVGFSDRTFLKDTLCVALAKSEEEVHAFDECFDMFFTREEFQDRREGEDSEEDDEAAGFDPELIGEQALAQLLLDGSASEMAQAMERAANEANVANIRFGTQRGLFTRRVLDKMGLRDLEKLILSLKRSEDDGAADMAAELEQGRQYLFEQARQYINRQFELYARNAGEELREEFLMETRLGAVDHRDIQRMHRIVRRMAKQLATKYNKRRKHTRRGVLDVRRTLRRNMAHGGIPFETIWKQTKIEKPKIVAMCDVSGSVAASARFLLLFLYSLNEVISSLRSYAFSANLIEVSDILEAKTAELAVPEIVEKVGFRPTDYGRSFQDFDENFLDTVDRRTTVIILGDGRSNNTDPRVDLMRRIHDHAKSVIWLNPEPETFWGTGDSEMPRYKAFCHVAQHCSTVKDLDRIINDVLKTYFRA
ncbi:MAG: hypothetical protein ACJAU6_000975 [Alphaproteobacteria bacterium]|jgi:uncharacterized protein with von Willebrand factor type A (vWA) domain